jgi:hypothetical protein
VTEETGVNRVTEKAAAAGDDERVRVVAKEDEATVAEVFVPVVGVKPISGVRGERGRLGSGGPGSAARRGGGLGRCLNSPWIPWH